MPISQTQVSQLYAALMGRVSEGKGNRYWQTYDNQLKAAEVMLGTKAVAAYFGDALDTDEGFISTIYANTLNKTRDGANGTIEDSKGIDYWIGRLDGTTGSLMTRAEMMVSFIGVASKSTTLSGTQFSNRVEVSNYTADTMNENPENYQIVLSFQNSGSTGLVVTNLLSSVTAAKNTIEEIFNPSQEYILDSNSSNTDIATFNASKDTLTFDNLLNSDLRGTGNTYVAGDITDGTLAQLFSAVVGEEDFGILVNTGANSTDLDVATQVTDLAKSNDSISSGDAFYYLTDNGSDAALFYVADSNATGTIDSGEVTPIVTLIGVADAAALTDTSFTDFSVPQIDIF